MHGLDGLAMGACLTAAGLSRLHRPGWLIAALVVPILMHALFDFPLMLVTKNSGFAGVLLAWIFLETFVTIGVLWWCNNMRAAAVHAYGLLHEPGSPRIAGILILLCAPLLALIALLQDSHSGIAAVAMLITPAIFGIDLMYTGSKSSYSTSVRSKQRAIIRGSERNQSPAPPPHITPTAAPSFSATPWPASSIEALRGRSCTNSAPRIIAAAIR